MVFSELSQVAATPTLLFLSTLSYLSLTGKREKRQSEVVTVSGELEEMGGTRAPPQRGEGDHG